MVRPSPPNPNYSHSETHSDGLETDAGPDQGLPVSSADSEEVPTDALGRGFSLRRSSRSPSPPTSSEYNIGVSLLRNFLIEEFQRRNLSHEAHLFMGDFNFRDGPESEEVLQAADQFRILSDEFAQSPLRQWVRDEAAKVPLDTLDFDAFSDLLYGLFQEGGVTWERVVVLFYFCGDLAVRALQEKLTEQFTNIVKWSFKHIAGEKMLRWVTKHGGWVNVLLKKSVDNACKFAANFSTFGFIVVGILAIPAFATYLWMSQ